MAPNKIVALLCLAAAALLYVSDKPGDLIVNPDKSPCPGTGLHMLIVEDRPNRRDLPPEQFDAMMSSDIDELVRENGGHKYMYDQKQELSTKNDPWVKDAMALPRSKLPWLVLDFNGSGTSEPYPNTPQDAKALINKYLKK